MEDKKEMLTEEEVVETLEAVQKAFDLLDFSKGYADGVYSPMIQNTLMKNLNINSIVPDKAGIEDALKDASNNEEQLVSYILNEML